MQTQTLFECMMKTLKKCLSVYKCVFLDFIPKII